MAMHKCPLYFIFKSILLVTITFTYTKSQPFSPCPQTCGNLTIPFPFGTREGCYLNQSFLITCNNTKPYLRKSDIEVLHIAIEGELRIRVPVSYDCYDRQANRTTYSFGGLLLSSFPVSSLKNKFTAVGCDTNAVITGSVRQKYMTGCMSLCGKIKDVRNGSCSGIGCCQTSIPDGVQDFSISVGSFYGHDGIWSFNKCSYAFVVEEERYNFSSTDLFKLKSSDKFPVVLDWAVGETACGEARKNASSYVCRQNSVCYDSDNGPGYRCNCSEGYQGNPYVENGCTEINECDDPSLNDCTDICTNTAGNYTCSCPKEYHGDGRRRGLGCVLNNERRSTSHIVTASISVGLIAIFIGFSFTYWGIQKRQTVKVKENFFKQNGGIMLEQLLSKTETSFEERAKIFTEEELNKATKNFDNTNIIGQGGYGTVYKGTIDDNITVAIKKSKLVDRSQIEQFVNEVIVLSQIKHPNVVKLLGCCLETPVPLLVYEFITNNTLFHHLHASDSLSWETRMGIATETAAALAHMHSTPMHIIHRDVKSANILLDEEFKVKVSDFGVSRLVSLDQTQLATLVQGTFGYIDPEYFHSGLLTTKSDVYSFGVVLVELLTAKKVISLERAAKERSLASYFMTAVENEQLDHVLDERVKNVGNGEQIKGVVELARRCLRMKGDKRPTMEEVQQELEALRKFEDSLKMQQNLVEREPLLIGPFGLYGNNSSTVFDSMKNHELTQIDGGR
ncbi:hypothetical protein LguiA_018256 [Lonicera macranthoides]